MKLIPISIVVMFKKEGEKTFLWMQKRESSDELNGLLEFPGGKVEPYETPADAALREVTEEVGVSLERSTLKLNSIFNNHLEKKTISLNIFTYDVTKSAVEVELSSSWYCVSKVDTWSEKIPPANQVFIKSLLNSIC